MSLLEQLALVGETLIRTVRQLMRPEVWVPWILLGLFQIAVVWALWSFAHPALSWFMVPLVERALGPAGLHYPELFRRLPTLVARADMVISATLSAVLIGAATRVFSDRFLGAPVDPGRALREALRRAPALIVAQLPFHLINLGLGTALGLMLGEGRHGGLVRLAGLAVALGGPVMIQALGLYVTALVVIERRSPLDAWRKLPRAWARGLWAALPLSAALALAQAPFFWLESRASMLVNRGTPEVVGLFVVLALLAMLCAALLVTGSVTLVFLVAIRRADEEPAT